MEGEEDILAASELVEDLLDLALKYQVSGTRKAGMTGWSLKPGCVCR